jgi:DNA-directed RNA polymerase subunit M/transcription elongation factor TFIIS
MNMQLCPKCGSNVLTTKQYEEKKHCTDCQKIHAQTLKERLEIENREPDKQEFR